MDQPVNTQFHQTSTYSGIKMRKEKKSDQIKDIY